MASTDTTTDATTTTCASCGKEGGNLNTCNKCNMIKYCNAACKKKHRSKHKKACERRVAELHGEALFKEHPPLEDCPICFLPLPLDRGQTTFQSCCGKIICAGCDDAMDEEARGRRKVNLCAFCRVPEATSDEENVKRLMKLTEANNANAFYNLGGYYARGEGMLRDFTKANELYLKAGELGCAEGYCKLGYSYRVGRGVEIDKEKAKYYCELAAMNGNVKARHNLGFVEVEAGNEQRAMKHFVIAAKAGFKPSLDAANGGFMSGYVTKDEYADTFCAYQKIQDEMKSDTRDEAREYRL